MHSILGTWFQSLLLHSWSSLPLTQHAAVQDGSRTWIADPNGGEPNPVSGLLASSAYSSLLRPFWRWANRWKLFLSNQMKRSKHPIKEGGGVKSLQQFGFRAHGHCCTSYLPLGTGCMYCSNDKGNWSIGKKTECILHILSAQMAKGMQVSVTASLVFQLLVRYASKSH